MIGGPIVVFACKHAAKTYPTLSSRLNTLLFGFIAGPVPMFVIGAWALFDLKKRRHLRGAGRAWFAIACGVTLVIPLSISLVKVLART